MAFKEVHEAGPGAHAAAVGQAPPLGSVPQFRQMGVSFSPSAAYGYGAQHATPGMMGLQAGAKAFGDSTNKFFHQTKMNQHEEAMNAARMNAQASSQQYAKAYTAQHPPPVRE